MSAEIPAGAMRFNSDSQKLEYWNGSAWFQVHTATPNLASAGDPTPGGRGVFQGGLAPSDVDTVDYINISSTGNAMVRHGFRFILQHLILQTLAGRLLLLLMPGIKLLVFVEYLLEDIPRVLWDIVIQLSM